ncbi:glutathionylspermidine synthase family protein [Enterococcus rivorum]|uniref:glutathionylspermidine synthase family protein n=1 Tax=Enterococcus rivorum TaxID=762845 RepID=UPI00362ADD97
MKENIQLVKIPEGDYSDYRYEVIFKAYKWDPQVEDANTVSEYIAVLDETVVAEIASFSEQLAMETIEMETELLNNLFLAKELGLPNSMCRAMKKAKNYKKEDHVRLMRFDFHPTDEGWKISEVNSDVPGGFAESSILPEVAARFVPDSVPSEKFSQHLLNGFKKRIKPDGTIGFVHATSYSDDRQVMQFMGDYFEKEGYRALYLAPNHAKFENNRVFSTLENNKEELAGLIRFFPLEWMTRLPFSAKWQGYYSTVTPSCNHPVAMLTQPKSLPLIWNRLATDCKIWKQLLPETKLVIPLEYEDTDYIYKPVFGRVGGDITIKEATSEKEFERIKKRSPEKEKRMDCPKKIQQSSCPNTRWERVSSLYRCLCSRWCLCWIVWSD